MNGEFLSRLVRGERIDEPVAIVAAHPDDEILGLGSRLLLMMDLTLIHLTDGAPRTGDPNATRAYAERREDELHRAITAAGAGQARRQRYGYPDQQAILHGAEIVGRLANDLAGRRAVFTHPYEQGHPDHDAAALAVTLACGQLRACGRKPPERYEFASYHFRDGEEVYGRFWPEPHSSEIVLRLAGADADRRRAALACFGSQRDVIARFPADEERLRPAPVYRFDRPAPPQEPLYDRWGWPIDSTVWRERADRILGFADRLCV